MLLLNLKHFQRTGITTQKQSGIWVYETRQIMPDKHLNKMYRPTQKIGYLKFRPWLSKYTMSLKYSEIFLQWEMD